MSGSLYVHNNKILLASANRTFAVPNLKPENIKAGVNIGGVVGSFVGGFIDSVLEHNSWAEIKRVIDAGYGSVWLGQTKTVESGTYQGYHLQLVDVSPNRYQKSDNSGYTNAVFQFVELLPTSVKIDSAGQGYHSWVDIASNYGVAVTSLPTELKELIPQVKVPFASFSGNITTFSSKGFPPCEYEITGVQEYGGGSGEGSPQYQYYVSLTAEDRIKYKMDSPDSSTSWWLRSLDASAPTTKNCVVNRLGEVSTVASKNAFGLSPCFAL